MVWVVRNGQLIGFELRSSNAIINLAVAVEYCKLMCLESSVRTQKRHNANTKRTAPLLNFNNRCTGFDLLGLFSNAWFPFGAMCSVRNGIPAALKL